MMRLVTVVLLAAYAWAASSSSADRADGGQRAVPIGKVVLWGCRTDTGVTVSNVGQCRVPSEATSGVTAISASDFHNLALKTGGLVIAWGCRGRGSYGQCSVPAAARSGVTAIAAGERASFALTKSGRVL